MKRNQQQNPLGEKPSTTQISNFANDLKWIEKIGGRLAVAYAVVFLGSMGLLIKWYLPKELSTLREFVKADSVAQLQPLQERLSSIEGQLRILTASMDPNKALQAIAALDQRAFSESLPVLRKVAEQSASEVKPNQKLLQQMAEKLRHVSENSPDYWPTVLQFIKFATSGMSPNVPPPGPPQITIGHNIGLSITPIKNSVVLLESGELVNTQFENSRIIFTQNPVLMRNVRFINCVFEMPVTNTPSPSLKQATQQLLASNLASVTIPSL